LEEAEEEVEAVKEAEVEVSTTPPGLPVCSNGMPAGHMAQTAQTTAKGSLKNVHFSQLHPPPQPPPPPPSLWEEVEAEAEEAEGWVKAVKAEETEEAEEAEEEEEEAEEAEEAEDEVVWEAEAPRGCPSFPSLPPSPPQPPPSPPPSLGVSSSLVWLPPCIPCRRRA
jgi:hypothetical protein